MKINIFLSFGLLTLIYFGLEAIFNFFWPQEALPWYKTLSVSAISSLTILLPIYKNARNRKFKQILTYRTETIALTESPALPLAWDELQNAFSQAGFYAFKKQPKQLSFRKKYQGFGWPFLYTLKSEGNQWQIKSKPLFRIRLFDDGQNHANLVLIMQILNKEQT
jgi:hypothetical protein